MADIQALNSKQHRNLRVVAKRGADYGEAVHIVPVVADELRELVLEYPVILVKDEDTGRFGMCAMLGFEQGENLYLDGENWDAFHIPLQVRRQPFSLTFTAEKDGAPDPASLVIAVDMESKRVGEDEGEALFNEDGSQSEFLQKTNDLLARLGPAEGATEVFINTLADHELLEPARLDVQLGEGEKRSFEGLYSISDERLQQLEGDTLAELYKRGFLQAAWLMLASTGNMRKLLMRKANKEGGNVS